MFLLIVGHDNRNRRTIFEFIRSGETVSRYFHIVTRALISMYKGVVKPANINNSPQDKESNPSA
ncbi:hypothetical protein Scep_028249 [Stephania cephalantha]|uniref:DUF8040 domain-containing protein n=1 Tax=Stephania cephalantha TaxID=152367 RepID=A0AAP0ECS4_9MAGN